MIIRPAHIDDIPAITEIYNEAVLTTNATFDTSPKTLEDRTAWFHAHDTRNPVLVAVLDDEVTGWASLSKWSDRAAYDDTAELSVYVHSRYRSQGIGRQLMEQVLRKGSEAGLHSVISRIVAGNAESLHLHQMMAFQDVGVMREVGRKNGELLDVHILQKIFTDPQD